MIVWVYAWEQQCCGTPFAVGRPVEWTVTAPDEELLPLFSPAEQIEIDGTEGHHDDPSSGSTRLSGTVRSIRAVTLTYAASPTHPRSSGPVPGSARTTPIYRSDGSEVTSGGFAGYLVDLDTSEHQP